MQLIILQKAAAHCPH